MKKLPETSEKQGPLGAFLGHPKISGSFCAFGGVLREAEEDEICFCFFPWGYRMFILLFRLNFSKNLDFPHKVTSDVMLMSIIRDKEHCHG